MPALGRYRWKVRVADRLPRIAQAAHSLAAGSNLIDGGGSARSVYADGATAADSLPLARLAVAKTMHGTAGGTGRCAPAAHSYNID
jgi:hypothetical protein